MALVVEPNKFPHPVAVGFLSAVSQVPGTNECAEAVHEPGGAYGNGNWKNDHCDHELGGCVDIRNFPSPIRGMERYPKKWIVVFVIPFV